MKLKKHLQTMTVAASILASVATSRADTLTGEYILALAGNAAVWDISGTYFESFDIGGAESDTQYTIYQDADGKISGTGTFSISVLGFYIDGDIDITGTMKGSGKATRLQMTLLLNGDGSSGGATVTVAARGNLRAQVNAALQTLVGRMTVRACATGDNGQKRVRRCASQGQSYSSEIPDPDMDGSWDLNLNVTTTDTAVGGAATATLSNGEMFGYSVSGSHNTRKGTTTLTLTPDTGTASLKLKNAAASEGVLTAGILKGVVAGQKVTAKTLAP